MSEIETIAMLETQEGGEHAVAAQDLVTPEPDTSPAAESSKGDEAVAGPSVEDLTKAYMGDEGAESEAELVETPAETPADAPKPEEATETTKEPADAAPTPDALKAFAERFGVTVDAAPAARESLVADFNRILATEAAGAQAPASDAQQTQTQSQPQAATTTPKPQETTVSADSAAMLAELEGDFGADSAAVKLFRQQAAQIAQQNALIEGMKQQTAKEREAFEENAKRADAQRTWSEVVQPFFAELTKDPRLAAKYGVKAPSKEQLLAQVDLMQKADFYQQGKAREGVRVSTTDALKVAAEAIHADLAKGEQKRIEQAEQRHNGRSAAPATAGRTKGTDTNAEVLALTRAYRKAHG
jgi:hypothetical protein